MTRKTRSSRLTFRADAETLELLKSKKNVSKYLRSLIKADLTKTIEEMKV